MRRASGYFGCWGAVLAIVKFGQKSLKPWLLSLAVELASRGLARLSNTVTTKVGSRGGGYEIGRSSPADLLGGRNGSALSYNQADQDENQRRELLLAYYLLRSPMYQAVTKYGLHPSLDLRLATANAVGLTRDRSVGQCCVRTVLNEVADALQPIPLISMAVGTILPASGGTWPTRPS